MKFMYESNLEQRLIDDQIRIDEITTDLISTFDECGFEKSVQVNGLNFECSKGDVYASFFVDNKLNYKGYVTTDATDNINYSVKGTIDNVMSAANDIIDMFYNQAEN